MLQESSCQDKTRSEYLSLISSLFSPFKVWVWKKIKPWRIIKRINKSQIPIKSNSQFPNDIEPNQAKCCKEERIKTTFPSSSLSLFPPTSFPFLLSSTGIIRHNAALQPPPANHSFGSLPGVLDKEVRIKWICADRSRTSDAWARIRWNRCPSLFHIRCKWSHFPLHTIAVISFSPGPSPCYCQAVRGLKRIWQLCSVRCRPPGSLTAATCSILAQEHTRNTIADRFLIHLS